VGHLIWTFAQTYQAQLGSIVTVIIGAFVTRFLRLRPKLFYSVKHSSNIIVEQPLLDPEGKQVSSNQIVRTASIVVENTGLHPAKGVEVAFNWKPQIMNIFPGRAFSEVPSALGRYSLKFDTLAPGEQTTIDIMAINAELPLMSAVRCDECQGKLINMAPQRVWPTWFLRVILAIMILGASTAVYLVIRLIQIIAT
jgi:hypothetical protein